ncbi:hypothetical protein RO3G_09935 [Rhizopus delemar RA 99-880]|uniref:Retrotransposon gag domain-containing protein n=1 Tax=Rhizopus delemar (strain RA 99-880 / ATCC MYA-4621 / FGSC 9543 / NRRL 43880) TaxID=246409 RepID=I1C9U5_RHIO9|nr:hypothetical protein RO3G_09935 [Rhizopus delemar RA 99-880]|eukprot:EIE85225.1 hypothetical protein RO3G_09935 [Rhizopus delemar RA 99-880]
MATYNTGHIALANNYNYKPVPVDFHGYEGEDFRYFLERLESYLAINNVHDARKLAILRSLLKGAAKVFFEKDILKKLPDVKYEQAIEALRSQYVTAELIQNYELEFNDMIQGEQEHPRIFLARLREAADLANIEDEAVIESRFRAGLQPEIKRFCIQSSSKTLKDWMNHAEGWWNANRPRRIAMVDNPFIPRNANQALVYPSDSYYQPHHTPPNHNIELIDDYEYGVPVLPYREVQHTNMPVYNSNDHNMLAINQLAAMDTSKGYPSQQHGNRNHHRSQQTYNHQQIMETNQQQDLVDLIQKTIRMEFNNHQQYQQPARNYNRNNRYNNSNSYNDYNNNSSNNNGNNRYNTQMDNNNVQQQTSNTKQPSKN